MHSNLINKLLLVLILIMLIPVVVLGGKTLQEYYKKPEKNIMHFYSPGGKNTVEGGFGRNCTHVLTYWKNHAGLISQDDEVTRLLPVWLGSPDGQKSVNVKVVDSAIEYLVKSSDNSNGINKIYAQLLGAKLNLKSGTRSMPFDVTEIDEFLAEHNAADWERMSDAQKNQVLIWAARFEDFNSGYIGPGHCPS